MARGKDTKVAHKLDSGKHHRVDRKRAIEVTRELEGKGVTDPKAISKALRESGAIRRIEAGESFTPSEQEREQNKGRLSRSTKYFTSPGIPGIHF